MAIAQSTPSDIRGSRPWGGNGLTHFLSGGTNHARREPGRSRDSPVTLLHCSIRTRRIGTALVTRRAQRGSPAQGWRVRTAAGIRPADPFLAWIHGSVPQVQPRPCGTVSRRSACREIETVRTVRHPCSQLDLRGVLQYPQDELLERGPAVLGVPLRAQARRSVHVRLLPLCALVCPGTRCGRRGHLMVRSLSSEAAIWF